MSSPLPYQACFRCFHGCEGVQFPLTETVYRCPKCNGLLDVQHDLEELKAKSAAEWKQLFEERYATGA